MRRKVREVLPPTEEGDLEELVADELITMPAPKGEDADPGGSHRTRESARVQLAGGVRPLAPTDLGPNGDVVLALLARAADLTAEECRRLAKIASWRWGLLALVPAAGSVSVARTTALIRGRRNGRSAAIATLQAVVPTMVGRKSLGRLGPVVSDCVFNACLAVLARDLIDIDAFEVLFGPWREVMHH